MMLGVVGGVFEFIYFKQTRYDSVLFWEWLAYLQSVYIQDSGTLKYLYIITSMFSKQLDISKHKTWLHHLSCVKSCYKQNNHVWFRELLSCRLLEARRSMHFKCRSRM